MAQPGNHEARLALARKLLDAAHHAMGPERQRLTAKAKSCLRARPATADKQLTRRDATLEGMLVDGHRGGTLTDAAAAACVEQVLLNAAFPSDGGQCDGVVGPVAIAGMK